MESVDQVIEEVEGTTVKATPKKKAAPRKKRVIEDAVKKAPVEVVTVEKVMVGVDIPADDVLKLQAEGHELFFEEKERFLELDAETLSRLKPTFRRRYRVAKAITCGEDVIGIATDGVNGFKVDYNVRPGSASENMMVYGKDPSREYHWGTPQKHSRHLAEGWEVDTDPNIKTRFDESGTRKTIGGQSAPEANLYSRPKAVGQAIKNKRKELRDSRVVKQNDSMKESILKAGARVIGS